MTHTITTDRDLDSLLHAIVANPGDHAARFALADLSCDRGDPEVVGLAIRLPGKWLTDWDCIASRYVLHWRLDNLDATGRIGVLVYSLRRKHAPRCGKCRRYQPIAGPGTGWQWRCHDCCRQIGRRLRWERARDDLLDVAGRLGDLQIAAALRHLDENLARRNICPICSGTGLVGESLCSLCDATGEVARSPSS